MWKKDLNIVPALHIRYRNRKSMFSSLKLIFPHKNVEFVVEYNEDCLLYTSPSPRD